MGQILKVDTDGNKGLLAKGEFGYDDYTDGGDAGRVHIGTGDQNIPLATKAEVDAAANIKDVVTELSLNANTLKYKDEEGIETDIDLSLYLDDSNLARLVNGTLDGSTGIATFTRDDDTTFDLDLSALLDDTKVTVVDNLTSTDTEAALSANQGRVLDDKISQLTTIVEW